MNENVLPKQNLKWIPTRKMRRGRPEETSMEDINGMLATRGLDYMIGKIGKNEKRK